jgi:uncharacterized protein (DUF486 family)
VTTVALLFASTVFMTAAWYGHLRVKGAPLWLAILASWGIAFLEYCLQAPTNRWGYGQFTVAQLKILVVVAFAWLWLGETPRWNEAVAFGLVLAAVVVASLPA